MVHGLCLISILLAAPRRGRSWEACVVQPSLLWRASASCAGIQDTALSTKSDIN